MIRKLYFISIVLIFCTNYLISQCDNNVSTDPAAPGNEALPDSTEDVSAPYGQDVRYLNGFDWWSPNSYTLEPDMAFNTNGTPYGAMSNIQSSNQSSSYSYLNKALGSEEMNPNNGWELLLSNLGRYPDNQTPDPASQIDLNNVPYLVFYHRYKGIIRVFVRYGQNSFPNDAVDGLKINLYHDNAGGQQSLSGIFRLGDGMDRSLDQETKTSYLSTVVPPNGQVNFWLSGDFQMAYDPCVCTYPTNVKLNFEYFSTTSLSLTGRAISVPDEIIDQNGNITNPDFLSGVDFSSELQAENGFIIYEKMGALVDDYIAKLEDYETQLAAANEYNDKLEKDLAVLNVAKIIFQSGINLVTGSPQLSSLISLVPGISDWEEASKNVFWKELDKVLMKELDLYISDNFQEKSEPEKPSLPTASFTEMNFDGELNNVLPINGPLFMTPGSFKNSDPLVKKEVSNMHSYPIYNQPLGVFALLETPKVQYDSEVYLPDNCNNKFITINNLTYIEQTFTHAVRRQLRIAEPLKYTFNSSLDILDYSVEGSIVSEYSEISGDNSINESISEGFINSSSTTFPGTGANNTFRVQSDLVPVDALLNHVSEFSTFHETQVNLPPELEYTDQMINEYCQENINSLDPQKYTRYSLDDIFLKLVVNVVYDDTDDKGEQHEYTYVFTYKLNEDNIIPTFSPIYPNLQGSAGDFTQYPENLFLNGENFDGSPVEGCELNGNTYTCKAWNNITVEGNFTVASGYNVDVEAGNEINIVAESNTPPEMQFSIVPVLDFSDPMPPQDATAVAAFCNDNNAYQANTSTKSGKKTKDNESSTKSLGVNSVASNFDFTLYPNPTNGGTNVSIVLENDAEATLIVTDLSGKKLIQQLNNELLNEGENRLILDSHSLAPGIYLVHLTVNGKRYVKRLVKQ
tara:strand:- start:66357 stop:69095 length:2739 start_codon:yes stop_codon:yes gene_type:complete